MCTTPGRGVCFKTMLASTDEKRLVPGAGDLAQLVERGPTVVVADGPHCGLPSRTFNLPRLKRVMIPPRRQECVQRCAISDAHSSTYRKCCIVVWHRIEPCWLTCRASAARARPELLIDPTTMMPDAPVVDRPKRALGSCKPLLAGDSDQLPDGERL